MVELAEWIRDMSGSSFELVLVPRPEDDPTVRKQDIRLARMKLAWEPQVDTSEALKRIIPWFREHSDIMAAEPYGRRESHQRQ